MRLKCVSIEFLEETGGRWDQFNVRGKCTPGTWPGDGKGFVSYMKPRTWNT